MTFVEWRERARKLLAAGVLPEIADFGEVQSGLFAVPALAGKADLRVPKQFLDAARIVSMHADPARWTLLYRVLFRLASGESHLLAVDVDPDVRALRRMHREVGHEMHRIKGLLRFRRVLRDGEEEYVGWHDPQHDILEAVAPWFSRRFGGMHWSILTPQRSAYWDTRQLRFGPGVPRSAAPSDDALEDLWRTYYASTFNPARVNEKLLRGHMPGRFWGDLPEAQVIPELLLDAGARELAMRAVQPRSAAEWVPAGASLEVLRDAIQSCRGCDLYRCATQPVFGEGPSDAEVMFVAEQPGDNEDREGRPFVGPAGEMFDAALSEAGLDRASVYITGAVKHFKFEERGKRRIHKTANRAEVVACQPWLDAQIAAIRPRLLVAMGATAALTLTGRQCSVLRERGRWMPHRFAEALLITVHPSFLLRLPDPERKAAEYRAFVADLAAVRDRVRAAA